MHLTVRYKSLVPNKIAAGTSASLGHANWGAPEEEEDFISTNCKAKYNRLGLLTLKEKKLLN